MAFNPLNQYVVLDQEDMGATFASEPQSDKFQDNVGIQLKWIGTPVGTFGIQVSNDYFPGDATNAYNAGTWTDLTLSSTISAAGSADNAAINLKQLPFSYYRITYTRTSGTGLVTARATHKGV